jgi:prephenate dehydratase
MTLPRPLRIAIQGERGAFSEEAAQQLLGPRTKTVPTRDFPHMFSSVARHRAHACLAPMENSLVGSIYQNYDLLLQYGLVVRGEVYLRVSHCLIAPVGTYFEDIRRVYSHPIALDQCQDFFRRHPGLETVSTYDTAGSVQDLVTEREPGAAAIAGRTAARYYGAKVMAEGLEDDPANYTRFFLLTLGDSDLAGLERRFLPGQVGPMKTSVVFYVENSPGSLVDTLGEFSSRGLDLTRIESRPVRGKPFEYLFYLDFLGSPRESPGAEAVAALLKRAGFARILGTYPSGRLDWVGSDAPLLPRGLGDSGAEPPSPGA